MANPHPPRPKARPRRASKPSAPAKRARIEIQVAPSAARLVHASALRSAARAALDGERIRRRVSLTIVITGDAALRKLNRDFLGIDAPTDVLSFASVSPYSGVEPLRSAPVGLGGHTRNGQSTPAGEDEEYLGDVIISLARARAQAKSGGHPLIDELRLLVIHGVLHLLGHDHATISEKERMWAAQSTALKRAGASIDRPTQ